VTFATIDALRESLGGSAPRKERSPEYTARMMHDVPETDVVDRAAFVLARCRDKCVLHVGASGKLHEAILATAATVWGIDRADNGEEIVRCDLDDVRAGLPEFPGVNVVVCGEVIEHLGNPLHFLKRLRAAYPGVPVIVTVPNAFADIGRKHMADGVENVHVGHFCWYSWRTLKTLVESAGYKVNEFYWYGHGRPGFTEGLVFVCE
jgi:hypothetical protein